MTDELILDIFYNQVIPEMQKGKVDCYFTINILFNLTINNEVISKCDNLAYEGLIIPTLNVTNKKLFDGKLIEYVKKALNTYNPSDFSFLDDLESESKDNLKAMYLVKYVICTLFANATFRDFAYPINFLESRIAMLDNRILNSEEEIDLGYIESIGARIYLKEEVSPIKAETPYRIKSYLEFDDGYKLLLPEMYAGNNGKKIELYGIQKTTKSDELEERPYLKQIRKGFIAKINGAPEHYFLAVMLLLSLCKDQEIEVIPFLVERWNAKRIAMQDKAKKDSSVLIEDYETKQELIQANITNIFIRYFTKLEDVTEGMDISLDGLEFQII